MSILTVNDLVDVAITASHSGGRLQSSVREFITGRYEEDTMAEVANAVAQVATLYRNKIEDWVQQNDPKARRKIVNNIINDVSRICRGELNHAIVCTQRKGGYVYAAKLIPTPILPSRHSVAASSLPTAPAVYTYEREYKALVDQVSTPKGAFTYLLDSDWPISFIASELLEWMKEQDNA